MFIWKRYALIYIVVNGTRGSLTLIIVLVAATVFMASPVFDLTSLGAVYRLASRTSLELARATSKPTLSSHKSAVEKRQEREHTWLQS